MHPPQDLVPHGSDASTVCSERPRSIVVVNDRGFRYGAGAAVLRQVQSFLLAGHKVALIASNLDTDWHRDTDFSILKTFPGTWRGIYAMPALPRPEEQGACASAVGAVLDSFVRILGSLEAEVVIVGNMHGAHWPVEWIGHLHDRFLRVVAFTHDASHLTGRCAYPGDCRRLYAKCDAACPTAEEYPKLSPGLIGASWEARSKVFDRADGVPIATNSHWMADVARHRYPAASFIQCVHFGLDELAYAPIGRTLARRLLGLPMDGTVVCTGAVDASERRKGGDLLFSLIETLGRRAGTRVLVFGLTGALQERLASFPHVRCVGLVRPEEMPLLFSAADIFVGLSREEAFGQTFMEAAACGTPSVAFGVGGIPEVVRHGETGLLCPEPALDPLLEAVTRLLDAPVLRHAYGRHARAWVSQYFTLTEQSRRWERYLTDCPPR